MRSTCSRPTASALFTSYGEKYLGDPAFVPVFEELNRRKAVVYTHPVNPACCTHLADGVGPSSIEFATDTTRTIASLIFGKGGTAFRCPDVRFIWSHSGGTLPFLIGRFIREQVVRKDPRMPDGPEPIIRKYFYEIAQGNEPGQFAALLKIVPVSQLLFGSDFPYREAVEAANGIGGLPVLAPPIEPRSIAKPRCDCCRSSPTEACGAHIERLPHFAPDTS